MFIGRAQELATLERAWARDDFQFIVVYGRRRVGKSRLLTHFANGKRGIYHLAQETNPKTALEQFSGSVAAFSGQAGLHYQGWGEALDGIASLAESRRLLLAIDEFPYLAEHDHSLLSLFQNAIDTKLAGTALLLVLCGSTVRFMEREVLGAKSPLFGRRTGQMLVQPFDYLESAQFVPEYSDVDKALAYCVFGGVPHYLSKLDGSRTLAENIHDNILDPHSYLYDEPALLLKQELREPAVYNAAIGAIASGASRLNEIATRIGEDASKCGKYIQTLVDLGYAQREAPMGGKPGGRKTIYSLSDPFFIFWYSFVFSNRSILEQGLSDFVLGSLVLPRLDHYAGRLFERVCMEFMRRQNRYRGLPFVFLQLGRWWGTDNRRKTQAEIDIVALGQDDALFGECKWTNAPADLRTLDALAEKSEAASFGGRSHYALFSKSGFTRAVAAEAQKRGALLFSLDDLYRPLP